MDTNITLLAKQVRPYEKMICSLTGQVLYCGDWYYEDEDGKIYLYEAYHQRKQAIEEERFDYNKLMQAQSENDYKNMLKKYEREVLEQKLDTQFDKKFKQK